MGLRASVGDTFLGGAFRMSSPRLEAAMEQVRAARRFTLKTLEQVPEENWFVMPGGVTHVAWQFGHLAIAQYRLCLVRLRGDQPGDSNLITPEWIGLFGKGSTPDPDRTKYPSIDAIRGIVERVHGI